MSEDLILPKSKTNSENRICGPSAFGLAGAVGAGGTCPDAGRVAASGAIVRTAPRINCFITGRTLAQFPRTSIETIAAILPPARAVKMLILRPLLANAGPGGRSPWSG